MALMSRRESSQKSQTNFAEVDICLLTEGTYPFVKGGVSSVIHQIISTHPQFTFGIVPIAWDGTSGSKVQFELPKNVVWIKPLILKEYSPARPPVSISSLFGNSKRTRTRMATEIFDSLDKIGEQDFSQIKQLYLSEFSNTNSSIDFHELLSSKEFMEILIERYRALQLPLAELFWLQREFFPLALRLMQFQFPKAKVYHSHTAGYAGLAAGLASLQQGGKFLLTEHALYIRDMLEYFLKGQKPQGILEVGELAERIRTLKESVWQKWFLNMGELIYHLAHKTTYLYPEILKDAKKYGSSAEKAAIIPNGVRFDKFKKTRLAQKQRHLQRNFDERNFTWKLAFIGRIVPIKGIPDLIEAANQLKKSGAVKFHLDLFGPYDEDPAYFAQCKKDIERCNLTKNVTFHGGKDLTVALEDIDIVILSSHSEALPVVLLEAMASGIPVVATDVGGVRQVVESRLPTLPDHPAGIVVPSRCPQALTKAVRLLTSDRALYEYLSVNGLHRASKEFAETHVMGRYTSQYENLMSVQKPDFD